MKMEVQISKFIQSIVLLSAMLFTTTALRSQEMTYDALTPALYESLTLDAFQALQRSHPPQSWTISQQEPHKNLIRWVLLWNTQHIAQRSFALKEEVWSDSTMAYAETLLKSWAVSYPSFLLRVGDYYHFAKWVDEGKGKGWMFPFYQLAYTTPGACLSPPFYQKISLTEWEQTVQNFFNEILLEPTRASYGSASRFRVYPFMENWSRDKRVLDRILYFTALWNTLLKEGASLRRRCSRDTRKHLRQLKLWAKYLEEGYKIRKTAAGYLEFYDDFKEDWEKPYYVVSND